MAREYSILNAAGGAVLPTANGTFTTDYMSADYEGCHVYAEFFSDADGTTPATATAGVVTVKGSPMGGVFIQPGNGDTMAAADVSAGTYTPCSFKGMMRKGQITFAGVTGAAYARVTFWRY